MSGADECDWEELAVGWMITPGQIEGFEKQWNDAIRKRYPYLHYSTVPGAPPPQKL